MAAGSVALLLAMAPSAVVAKDIRLSKADHKQICAQAREIFLATYERFTYLVDPSTRTLAPLANALPADYRRDGGKSTFIYHFVSGPYEGEVRFGVRLSYTTEDATSIVNLWNNKAQASFQEKLEDYEVYHSGVVVPGRPYRRIKTQFHIARPRSDEPPELMSEYMFRNLAGNDRRAYVFSYNGVPKEGVCVNFNPFIPNQTTGFHVKIIYPYSEGSPNPTRWVSVKVEP